MKKSAPHNVQEDVAKHSTGSHVCSSAKNVVPSACVFHRGSMATRLCVPATITGRLSVEDPNVLEHI